MRRFWANIMLAALLAAALVAMVPLEAAANRSLPQDLTEMSLEDLMALEVTSAGKRSQKLADVAAAVFVITAEDIRRSGATSIPEALRMAPGVEVARIDAGKWAISVRGFNGRFANKLLVLIDGRTVYTPLFSGVYWDMQDTLLEDIDRIEVIRGPGAALWGANAVNGVINIITKHAGDTQGGLVTGGGGTEERGFGAVRYGGKWGRDTYFRVYAKYFNRDAGFADFPRPANDNWQVGRGGFRLDSKVTDRDSLTLSGDFYNGKTNETLLVPSLLPPFRQSFDAGIKISGAYFLSRWQRQFSPSSDLALQMYYDWTDRQATSLGMVRNTLDVDLQHRFVWGSRQEIIWGLGYRYIHDNLRNSFSLNIFPSSRNDQLFSAFVQDDLTLIKNRLHLILGSKFEHNDYNGFEVQPSARLVWTPARRHTFWAAVSRAVRTTSRLEEGCRLNSRVIPPGTPENPTPLPILASIFARPGVKSEKLVALELGYRFQPTDRLSLDLATFYNIYDDVRSGRPGHIFLETVPPPPHLTLPIAGGNSFYGRSYGAELAVDWRLLPWWRLQAAYTYLQLQMHLRETGLVAVTESDTGASPQSQFSLRSAMNLPKNLELDLWLRYVDGIPSLGIDRYVTLDARLAWKPRPQLELAIVGQNLLQNHRLEFKPEALDSSPTQVQRGVYGKATWRF